MYTPQIILIVLLSIDLLLVSYNHGENMRINIWASLLNKIIIVALLLWGGFFN